MEGLFRYCTRSGIPIVINFLPKTDNVGVGAVVALSAATTATIS